jgi:hypothetical protein
LGFTGPAWLLDLVSGEGMASKEDDQVSKGKAFLLFTFTPLASFTYVHATCYYPFYRFNQPLFLGAPLPTN